jgi:hypothetical protein
MEYKEITAKLREGAVSDIWYNAKDYNDDATGKLIEETQTTMHKAADELERLSKPVKALIITGSEAIKAYEEQEVPGGKEFLRLHENQENGILDGWDIREFRNEQHMADYMDGASDAAWDDAVCIDLGEEEQEQA